MRVGQVRAHHQRHARRLGLQHRAQAPAEPAERLGKFNNNNNNNNNNNDNSNNNNNNDNNNNMFNNNNLIQ